MADYWKSLPKKYCDFCKCWFADNKASVEFHERGWNHKTNVKKKLQELQKRGSKQQKEEMLYNSEMMKIESKAMKAFQSDVQNNPQLAKEFNTNIKLYKKIDIPETSTKLISTSRFGDDSSASEESSTLVNGRQRALETISKKLEKKSKWLEKKTSEGKTFYVNKETNDTIWEPPKCGFLSLEEQKHTSNIFPANDWTPESSTFKYNPYGKWQTVKYNEFDDKMIDLQLPDQQLEIVAPIVSDQPKDERIEFKEKTIDSLKHKISFGIKTEEKVLFKKRKTGSERNVRQRTDD
ncbi:WW domain-binding protein 4-like [Oppia nitens]|uniref:WW domain-binding protein 4-like n=1 Tax=Oppia nitens TaxID=1686743 RepID=UPI0023DB1DCF|nr:WW domain-binding protein 4-like [Oppia nitens]